MACPAASSSGPHFDHTDCKLGHAPQILGGYLRAPPGRHPGHTNASSECQSSRLNSHQSDKHYHSIARPKIDLEDGHGCTASTLLASGAAKAAAELSLPHVLLGA